MKDELLANRRNSVLQAKAHRRESVRALGKEALPKVLRKRKTNNLSRKNNRAFRSRPQALGRVVNLALVRSLKIRKVRPNHKSKTVTGRSTPMVRPRKKWIPAPRLPAPVSSSPIRGAAKVAIAVVAASKAVAKAPNKKVMTVLEARRLAMKVLEPPAKRAKARRQTKRAINGWLIVPPVHPVKPQGLAAA